MTGQKTGMDRSTGKAISGVEYVTQSIADILTTPIGTRVMRRDYGSRLFELIDQPSNPALPLLLAAATAGALAKWEPRLKLQRVRVSHFTSEGRPVLDLTGYRLDLPAGSPVSLQIPA